MSLAVRGPGRAGHSKRQGSWPEPLPRSRRRREGKSWHALYPIALRSGGHLGRSVVSTYVQRLVGAVRLDPATYEEGEANRGATAQAVGTGSLPSLAAGVRATGQDAGLRAAILAAAGSLAMWAVWSAVIWLVGTRLSPEPQTRSDVGELLRTTGFASAPGLLRVFGIGPVLAWLVGILSIMWMLGAMVVAVRQALDYRGTLRAVAVCGVGLVAYFGAVVVVGVFLGATQAILQFLFRA